MIFPSLFAIESVKIGVLAKRSDSIARLKWSETARYLSEQIPGHEFTIVPLSFEALFESVAKSEVDFVLTNTMYYVELEYRYGISRIATLVNTSSEGYALTSFGGVIFTQKKSGIKELSDLKGKRFGAVNINSFGGWVMAQKELKDHGIEAEDFSEFKFYGSHDDVVLAVKNGEIDAGTVRTDTIERMTDEGVIDFHDCQILSAKQYDDFPYLVSTPLYPEWPFAKLSSTSQALANKVLIALLQMPSDSKAAKDSHVSGWTIPLDYSKVHLLLETLNLGPYAEYKKITFARFYEKYQWWFYGLIIGLIVIVSVLLYVSRLNSKLKENKKEIDAFNASLEKKVHDRTLELKKMYSHEKYLKDLIKTIADVNELLITSFSFQTVIENSMQRLIEQRHYQFIWIGLLEGDLLEVASQSKEHKEILDKHSYDLRDHETNFAFKSAKSAIDLNVTVLERLSEAYKIEIGTEAYDCTCDWMITLPLRSHEDEIPVGMLSVYSDRKDGFEPEEVKILENLATDLGRALHAISQRTVLKSMELEKISNYEETILAFVNIIEQRDSYTAGHTIRVAEYCRLIAIEMGLDEKEILKLEKAAILHDIGKVVTPDAILLKPGKLTSLEYDLIKQHSLAGYRMLSKIDMYKDLAEIIKYHHARYDGKGYPTTKAYDPDAIPFLSHIMALADSFDTMTSNRVYKTRKTREEALEELQKESGTQFHPDVAMAAVRALKEVNIVETNQMPDSQLEQRRFAYFFLDALTDLYNENYLNAMLNTKKEDEMRYLVFIGLSHFSTYNKKYGWDKGDHFLKRFAAQLQAHFSHELIFRYHGDNFILLFDQYKEVSKEEILAFDVFSQSDVNVNLRYYDLKEGIPKL
jgi:phosphate/phosphite/phosphonate ABC transporter binding protein